MTRRTILTRASAPSLVAIHVAYTRTVGNGKPATIEGVDVFELTEDLGKFTSVTIIYDIAPVRSDFDRL